MKEISLKNITKTKKQAYLYKLECNQFESFLLESLDDFADKSSLDTVRLDHQIGTLKISSHSAQISWLTIIRKDNRRMFTARGAMGKENDGGETANEENVIRERRALLPYIFYCVCYITGGAGGPAAYCSCRFHPFPMLSTFIFYSF